jgi:hypothetical protein
VEVFSTVFWTVTSGTLVYVLGRLVEKAYIEPLNALWLMQGRIYDALIIHKPIYMGGGEATDEDKEMVRLELRRLASELLSRAKAIPLYKMLARIRLTLPIDAIEEARSKLVELADALIDPFNARENETRASHISSALGYGDLPAGLLKHPHRPSPR